MGNRPEQAPEPKEPPQQEREVNETGGVPSDKPVSSGSSGDGPGELGLPPVAPDGERDDDPCEINPTSILEAMLFVGNPAGEPLTSLRASELMRGVAPDEIPDLVDQLNRRYAARRCPYFIASEGAGYRMTLRREFWPIRNRFYGRIREARLSQAAIDVMAIVAYRQPVTAEAVSQHRGHPSGHLLAQLVHRRLLRIDRAGGQPRLARYWTTERFLGLFGLESLTDLPRSDEDVDTK
jgi:segregation and condensation protein B